MAAWTHAVFDSDGHLIESLPEWAEYMDPVTQRAVMNPNRQREGAFPSLGGFHGPRLGAAGVANDVQSSYVRASEHRTGSAEDYAAFMDEAGVEQSIIFTSEGLSVGQIQSSDYASRICRSYNDYVHDRYRRVDERVHPMALIPMQDVGEARLELRRAVKDLDLPGAMLPTVGLPLHPGHDYYWPLYQEAAELDCVLGFHGGATKGFGMDSFTNFTAVAGLHHSIPLMIALASMVGHGVLDRFPNLRVGFFEGGAAWVVTLLDRMERTEEFFIGGGQGGARLPLSGYVRRGQVLIGCEGNDPSLPHLVQRMGASGFAWASDYPHEVDLSAAKKMIQETVDSSDFTSSDKDTILGESTRSFFNLAKAQS
jgi:predicted TIM-barrel fold metal-dependent hydrolase